MKLVHVVGARPQFIKMAMDIGPGERIVAIEVLDASELSP